MIIEALKIMTNSAQKRSDGTTDAEIIFAIDEISDDDATAIIADITQDEAWIATDVTETVSLDEWK
ncbi:hypothetical protein DMJ13_19900 [halophilic archaeon]|nr:hypothetical protein DMJ13_19900 [halophilic archaeon]